MPALLIHMHLRLHSICLEEEAPSNLHKGPVWAGGGSAGEGLLLSESYPSSFRSLS